MDDQKECKTCKDPLRTKEEQERGTCNECERAISALVEKKLSNW